MTATATLADAAPDLPKAVADRQPQPGAELTTTTPAPQQQAIVSAERVHFDNVYRWGKLMAASGFFKDAREAAQAAVKVQAGYELGLPPGAAMRGVFVFDGKISLAAALMTSKVNQSSNYEFTIKQSDEKQCLIEWHSLSKRTREWRLLGTSSFSIEEAQTAGLASKDNWKKYPKAMLFARAMSAGCRTYCPELFDGAVYVPEEVNGTVTVDREGNVVDYEAGRATALPASPQAEPRNVTQASAAPAAASREDPAPAAPLDTREGLLAAVRAKNGIAGSSMSGQQMKAVLESLSAALDKRFTSLREVTDDDLRAYLGGPKPATAAAPAAEAEEVLYCDACGAQTSPKANAEEHAAGCPDAPFSDPGERQ